MTDISDQATIIEEQERESCLRKAREQRNGLQPTGFCYYCTEPVAEDRRFCDSDCRDQWEIHVNAMRRSGQW